LPAEKNNTHADAGNPVGQPRSRRHNRVKAQDAGGKKKKGNLYAVSFNNNDDNVPNQTPEKRDLT
jgi:hypothetical protein